MSIAKRWTIATILAVLGTASVGASAIIWLIRGSRWNASDLFSLLGIVGAVSGAGAALLFLPLTWLASFVAKPGRVLRGPGSR